MKKTCKNKFGHSHAVDGGGILLFIFSWEKATPLYIYRTVNTIGYLLFIYSFIYPFIVLCDA